MGDERDVTAGNVRLRITEAGAGGQPLLLLHGFTGSRHDFGPVVGPLAELGFHVVAPDQRGHGESDQPDAVTDYSWEHFAADALALADALGWDRFSLLGHSMGGMVAQEVAVSAPQRIVRLLLMDTSAEPLDVDEALRDAGVETARTHGTGVIADLTAGRDGPLTTEAWKRAAAADSDYAELGERNLRAASGAMYAAMLLAITSGDERYARLASLPCPTLVIVGDEDAPFLDPGRRLSDVIPGAELVVIPGAGHSPQFEAPAAWWAAVSAFLRPAPGQPGASTPK